MKNKSVSVVGLGKLGLPLAAAMASRGYRVTGYDYDAGRIGALQEGRYPSETGLEALLKKHGKNVKFTSNIGAIAGAELIFVVVPTPSLDSGEFSIKSVLSALQSIGSALKGKRGNRVVSIVSTVLPGHMAQLKAALEKSSGKTVGKTIGLCYNPAFIALGNVIENFLKPDFVLIGESDGDSGKLLEGFYRRFCINEPHIHRMNFVNAEITKISVNTFVTMKISFGNTLARICERIEGAHADIVSRAIGSDSRIGQKYLKGAVGYGGPCFPRDNKAFSYMAKSAGIDAHGSEATDRINREQIPLIAESALFHSTANDVIAVLGLSYKPDTEVVEESQGVLLARHLLENGRKLLLYDPAANAEAARVLPAGVTFARSFRECLDKAGVLILMTPWKEFTEMRPTDLISKNGHGPRTLIDCWRIWENRELSRYINYVPLGIGLSRKKPERIRK